MEAQCLDLEAFSAFLLLNNRRKSTTYRHLNTLKRLGKGIESFTQCEIEKYLARLKLNGARGAYINSILNTVNVYSQWKNLGFRIKQVKEENYVKATMNDEEIEAFLKLSPCANVSKSHWDKWNLFWEICAFCGMRPGEVALLKDTDCDMGRKVFVLTQTKTNDSRLVPVPPNIETHVIEYLVGLKGHYLFASERNGDHGYGKVFDNVDWHYNFHTRINRLGIKRTNLTPYSLRHSLITRLLEEDVNLFKVQKLVGHKRLETTAQYTHLTTKDIHDAIRKHPLIRRSTDPRNILTSLAISFNELFSKDDRFEKQITDNGDEILIRVKIKK